MFNILASLADECKRLGLEDEAKVIQAWVGVTLPHMMEETQFVEELYELYHAINTLPPSHILEQDYSFRHISYSIQGKSVRQVMGEIGFLLHATYQQGYLRHNIYEMKDRVRQSHIAFGVLLQNLIGLFGVYYNVANKEDIIQEELAQMAELFNTSIASMLGRLQQEFSHIRGATRTMLESGNKQYFAEDNEEIAAQAQDFFGKIEDLMLSVREVFYHSRSRIHENETEQLKQMMEELYGFYRSLDDLDSNLDLQGGEYSPEALMYWSIVFRKDKRTKKTQTQQRREVIDEISDKPYLKNYASSVELTSQLIKQASGEFIKQYRELNKAIRAIVSLNAKIHANLEDLIRYRGRAEQAKQGLIALEDSVDSVKEEYEDLDRDEMVEQIQFDFATKGLKLGITDLTVDKLADRLEKIFGRRPDFGGEELLQFSFKPTLQKLTDFLSKTAEVAKQWYDLWLGEIEDKNINDFNSHLLIIHNRLEEMQRNPMAFTEPQEKVWMDIFSFGNPTDDLGNATPGFSQVASQLITSDYYDSSEELDQESIENRIDDVAEKVTNFNSLIQSLLTDNPIPLSAEEFQELQEFVTKTNEHWREKAVEAVEGKEVEMSELDRDFIVSTIHILGLSDPNEPGELEKMIFDPTKPSYDEFVADAKVLTASENFKSRMITANAGKSFTIPYKKKGDNTQRALVLEVDPNQENLTFKTLEQVPMGGTSTARVVDTEVLYNLPSVEELSVLLRGYWSENDAEPDNPINDINSKLYPWYTEILPGEEEISEDVEDVIQESLTQKEKSPAAERLLEVMQRKRLEDTSLTQTPEGKQKGRRDIARVDTIEKNLQRMPSKVSDFTGKSLTQAIDTRTKDFSQYMQTLMKAAISQFSALQSLIQSTKDGLLESEQLLPAFPRIVYNVYDKINSASTEWKKWKTSNIEVVLNELRILIENIETKKKLEDRVRLRVETGLEGLPQSTIDMISDKFEELRSLVRA